MWHPAGECGFRVCRVSAAPQNSRMGEGIPEAASKAQPPVTLIPDRRKHFPSITLLPWSPEPWKPVCSQGLSLLESSPRPSHPQPTPPPEQEIPLGELEPHLRVSLLTASWAREKLQLKHRLCVS